MVDQRDTNLQKIICVSLNGQSVHVVPDLSLTEFLKEKMLSDRKGIAIAINNKVIPRSNWEDIKLQSNDNILAITPTQGG